MGFQADIAKFVKKANGNIEQAVRQTTILLAQGVVLKTPVDTGRARGNWQFGSAAIPTGIIDAVDVSGQTVLSKMIGQIGESSVGGITYIANNLPYIERLEDGYSDQAPVGMVRLTITEFKDYVNQAVEGIKK